MNALGGPNRHRSDDLADEVLAFLDALDDGLLALPRVLAEHAEVRGDVDVRRRVEDDDLVERRELAWLLLRAGARAKRGGDCVGAEREAREGGRRRGAGERALGLLAVAFGDVARPLSARSGWSGARRGAGRPRHGLDVDRAARTLALRVVRAARPTIDDLPVVHAEDPIVSREEVDVRRGRVGARAAAVLGRRRVRDGREAERDRLRLADAHGARWSAGGGVRADVG